MWILYQSYGSNLISNRTWKNKVLMIEWSEIKFNQVCTTATSLRPDFTHACTHIYNQTRKIYKGGSC